MPISLIVLSLLACSDKGGAADDSGGAGSGAAAITALDAGISEAIATVVTVQWTTDVALQGYVEYGFDESLGMSTPLEAEPATEHGATLMGLTADTEVFYRVVADGGAQVSDVQTVTTGSLPNDLPSFTVEGGGTQGYMVLPLLGAVTAPIILNSDGQIVWYWLDDRGLDVYRAKLSVDGKSVLYNAAVVSGDPSPDSAIVRVSMDGSTETATPIPLLAHDFVEFPDGTIGALTYEYRDDPTLGEVKGNQIVEVAPDGTQSVIWSAWDCFDPNTTLGDDPELGWTFTNALDYDPALDAYYVGTRNFSSIVKVNRADGACEWVLGGNAATISIDGSPFLHEHQFEVTEDTVIVFDNEGSAGVEARAIEYALDVGAGTASEIWSYQPDPPVQSFVLGDVARMSNGDTLVTWSVAGQINLASAAGETLWQLNSELGYAFGFDTYTPDLYVNREP